MLVDEFTWLTKQIVSCNICDCERFGLRVRIQHLRSICRWTASQAPEIPGLSIGPRRENSTKREMRKAKSARDPDRQV